MFFPETEYGSVHSRRKTCDAILVYGNSAVLMEFKIKTLKLKQTIIDCDFNSLIEDINMAFIESNEKDKAAKQIDETIKALRNGSLHLSGIEASTITNYYPIIVTFQNWPLGPFVYDLIRRVVNTSGLLRQSYYAPVENWKLTSDVNSGHQTIHAASSPAFLTHYIRTIVHSLDNSKNQLIEGHNILFTVDEIEIANSS